MEITGSCSLFRHSFSLCFDCSGYGKKITTRVLDVEAKDFPLSGEATLILYYPI